MSRRAALWTPRSRHSPITRSRRHNRCSRSRRGRRPQNADGRPARSLSGAGRAARSARRRRRAATRRAPCRRGRPSRRIHYNRRGTARACPRGRAAPRRAPSPACHTMAVPSCEPETTYASTATAHQQRAWPCARTHARPDFFERVSSRYAVARRHAPVVRRRQDVVAGPRDRGDHAAVRLVATDAVDNNTSEARRRTPLPIHRRPVARRTGARRSSSGRPSRPVVPASRRRAVPPRRPTTAPRLLRRRERGGHAARLRCDCRDGVAPRDADRVDAPGEQGAVVFSQSAVGRRHGSSVRVPQERTGVRVVGMEAAMNCSMHLVAAQHHCCDGAVVRCTQFQVLHASLALLLRHYCARYAMVSSSDAGTHLRHAKLPLVFSSLSCSSICRLLESYRAAPCFATGHRLETCVAISRRPWYACVKNP